MKFIIIILIIILIIIIIIYVLVFIQAIWNDSSIISISNTPRNIFHIAIQHGINQVKEWKVWADPPVQVSDNRINHNVILM